MIARLLPYPALAAVLFVVWMFLAQSVSPGQILLGTAVAVAASGLMVSLRPKRTKVASWSKALVLGWIVAIDILRSNLAVAWIIASNPKTRISSFIQFDLALRSEAGLTILALIITATPGTAWVQFDRASGSLVIHVFDLVDEDEWIDLVRTRYEALLIEIFEP